MEEKKESINLDSEEILIRYTFPTKFDIAAYGTLWKLMDNDGSFKLFIQLGKEGMIHWVGFGEFLENVFKNSLDDPYFIDKCLEAIENNGSGFIS